MPQLNNYQKAAYLGKIPFSLARDKKLSSGAKVLYSEIEAICSKNEFCSLTNKYFAFRFGCSEMSISNWVGQLRKIGVIAVDFNQELGNQRVITIGIRGLNESQQ
jgi:hypothetical protein